MKQAELLQHATCTLCKEKIGKDNRLTFYVLSFERHFVDVNAIQRQDGLAAFMGNAYLASVFDDSELAKELDKKTDITVCESCAIDPNLSLMSVLFDE